MCLNEGPLLASCLEKVFSRMLTSRATKRVIDLHRAMSPARHAVRCGAMRCDWLPAFPLFTLVRRSLTMAGGFQGKENIFPPPSLPRGNRDSIKPFSLSPSCPLKAILTMLVGREKKATAWFRPTSVFCSRGGLFTKTQRSVASSIGLVWQFAWLLFWHFSHLIVFVFHNHWQSYFWNDHRMMDFNPFRMKRSILLILISVFN